MYLCPIFVLPFVYLFCHRLSQFTGSPHVFYILPFSSLYYMFYLSTFTDFNKFTFYLPLLFRLPLSYLSSTLFVNSWGGPLPNEYLELLTAPNIRVINQLGPLPIVPAHVCCCVCHACVTNPQLPLRYDASTYALRFQDSQLPKGFINTKTT